MLVLSPTLTSLSLFMPLCQPYTLLHRLPPPPRPLLIQPTLLLSICTTTVSCLPPSPFPPITV